MNRERGRADLDLYMLMHGGFGLDDFIAWLETLGDTEERRFLVDDLEHAHRLARINAIKPSGDTEAEIVQTVRAMKDQRAMLERPLAQSRATHSAELREHAKERNQQRRSESDRINAKLIEWDDEIAEQSPQHSQEWRAAKIIKEYHQELPERIANAKPESLAKRIREARK